MFIGGAYLTFKKIIDVKIPLVYMTIAMLMSAVVYGDIEMMLPTLLGGGLIYGAIFMATDYSTNPNTNLGKIIFAIGCGGVDDSIQKVRSYA